jgi:uncharacterized membrane protein YedE/YeeE
VENLGCERSGGVTPLNAISSGTAVVVGNVLMVVGAIAILGGIGGAFVAMIKELRKTPSAASKTLLDALAKVINAVTEFVKTLVTSPVWLTLVVLGAALVGFGWWLALGRGA